MATACSRGVLLALSAASVAAVTPQELLAQMGLKQKIGQLTQLNWDMIFTGGAVDPAKLQTAFAEYGVGSMINSMFAGGCNAQYPQGWTQADWRAMLNTVQDFVLTHQNVTPAIPMMWGLDSVHGANYIANATLFPHNTGMAATFNAALAYEQAIIASLDTRSAGCSWMFSPVLGLGMNPLWSRLYETFGEDPFVGATAGAAFIRGTLAAAASVGMSYPPITASLKHYMGYSAPFNGKDRTDAHIPDAYLKQYFQPAFAAAIAAGASTVMINSGSVNGVPAHASAYLLTDVLRTELGFNGVAVTDWQDIEKLQYYHKTAPTAGDAIMQALAAGVDMSMVPDDYTFPDVLLQLVNNGSVPESRIDESVLRVLQMKIDVGLFTDPVVPPQLTNRIMGAPADQAVSLQAARESMTLLTNSPVAAAGGKPVLPLTWLPANANILVTGPAAVDMIALCGGWTLNWQGAVAPCVFPEGVGSSISAAVSALASTRGATVTTIQGVNFTDYDPAVLTQVTQAAAAADVVVMAIGEAPESETPGVISDLAMSPAQMALFAALNSTSTPVVTVLVEPRPRLLGAIADGSAGVIMAYLPCVHGGQAVAEVLFGVTNPSGRLPITYPRASGDLDVYYHKPWNISIAGVPEAALHNPQWDFGTGLSYSTLTYAGLSLSSPTVTPGAIVNITVTVTNAGPYDAAHSVLAFVEQLYRPAITPEVRMLKAFTKTSIASNAASVVTLTLDTSELAYWTPELDLQIDAGVYVITVGPLSVNLTLSTGASVQHTKEGKRVLPRMRADELAMTHRGTRSHSEHVHTAAERANHNLTRALVREALAVIVDEHMRSSAPLARDVALRRVRHELWHSFSRVLGDAALLQEEQQ